MENKLKLYGFNNLTKALSFNIYDVCYAKTEREQQKYIAYIDEQYNSDRLVKILTNVSQMIGAEVRALQQAAGGFSLAWRQSERPQYRTPGHGR